MSGAPSIEATRLLQRMEAGDARAGDELFRLLQGQMRDIAQRTMREERADHTLQPTALVNEAWLRMMGSASASWRGRTHFLCTAAKAMRNVLVDHARRRAAEKRGAHGERVLLDDPLRTYQERAIDLLALDEALERLAGKDAELARVVELRFFAGMTTEETGLALGLSVRQVEGAWVTARGWLKRELGAREQAGD